MSIEAITWALRVPIGGNAKVILLGLANHAHPDGREAYPSRGTLSEYAHCDPSTAVRNVRKLEADGWIKRDGIGPRGEAKYRLAMSDTPFQTGDGNLPQGNSPGVAPASSGGGAGVERGVAPAPPEPSLEPSTNRDGEDRARADDPKHSLPDDFPDELQPHARHVFRVLRSVAEQHGAREVLPLALGRVIMARRRKPLVQGAHDFAAWAADPPRPIRDVVASYRTWLDRTPNLQAAERLDADGLPSTEVGAPPAGVTRMPRRMSNAEQVEANVRALRDRAAGTSDTIGST